MSVIKDRMSPGPTHTKRLTAKNRQTLLDRWRDLGSPPIELPSGATIPDLERFLLNQELTMRQIAEALQ